MREHFPRESQEPGYFVKRMAEIQAEYEYPIYRRPPPSSSRWQAVRLTDEHCNVVPALKGQYGVVPVDYGNQNVGGMGPAFAGAVISNRRESLAYLSRISQQFDGDVAAARKRFEDYAIQVGGGADSRHVAPWGGGNDSQFLNGVAQEEEQAHFITVDVIVRIKDKNGKLQRELMPHLFQVAKVPPGEQALLQYGKGYFKDRPSIKPATDAGVVKSEPVEDNLENDDVSECDAASSSLTSLSSDDDGPRVSHTGKRLHTSDANPGASGARPLKRRHIDEQDDEEEIAPWPDNVPYRMLNNGLYVEDQAAMSERHGTYNTCASHAINQLLQGSAVRDVVQGAHLGEIRDYLVDNLGIAMEEMIALFDSAGGQAAQEHFEDRLWDMAGRIEGSGAAIVDLGAQRDDTESVFNHFVTLVRLASDERVYLLDSLSPRRLRSFDTAYDALEAISQDHAQPSGDTTLSILVPPEGAVLPPIQGSPCGSYVLNEGFVPQEGWHEAHAQTASSRVVRKTVSARSVEDYKGKEPGVSWDKTNKQWIIHVKHPITNELQTAAVRVNLYGGDIDPAWQEAKRIAGQMRKGEYVPRPRKTAEYTSEVQGVWWDTTNHRWSIKVRLDGDTEAQSEQVYVKRSGDDLARAIEEGKKKAEDIADQMRKGVYAPRRKKAAAHKSKVPGVTWKERNKLWRVVVKREEDPKPQAAQVYIKDYGDDLDEAMKAAERISEEMHNGTHVPQKRGRTAAYTSKVRGVSWDGGSSRTKVDDRRWRVQMKRKGDTKWQRATVYVRDHGGVIEAAMREAERIASQMRNGDAA